jgi:SAM-dependent methyltransferase
MLIKPPMPQLPIDDPSCGWEQIAAEFIAYRQHSTIGVATLRQWASELPKNARVLDLGCGFGVPVTSTLLEMGFSLYGIDASPSLVAEFKQRFPQVPIQCADVAFADFSPAAFSCAADHPEPQIQIKIALPLSQPGCREQVISDRRINQPSYDAIVAVGLMFLLPAETQQRVLALSAAALAIGGKLLFSAPVQACRWLDRSTARQSISLGRDAYRLWARQHGLALQQEWTDEGENHYFCFSKMEHDVG